MLPPKDGTRNATIPMTDCTSARLIDRLRTETQTGYPEIEEAATELARVAETAWLRQLSSWVVYGKLPSVRGHDFFIHTQSRDDHTLQKENDLLPSFVSQATASSILFIGKSLNQAQNLLRMNHDLSTLSERKGNLATTHLQLLSSLSLPITSSQLSRIVAEMRLSLSQNVLQHLLPMKVTLKSLSCLRQFLLLAHGEFAASLITEAESRIQSRQQSMGNLLLQDPAKALQGLSIKDAELNQSLQQVWRSLAAEDKEEADELLEHAQTCISLTAPKLNASRPSTSDGAHVSAPEMTSTDFNDLLFPSPTELSMTVTPPLDLFLSSHDVSLYSRMSSYLLAIRRGHHRLSELWRRTPARRDHPVAAVDGNASRARKNKRNATTRKVWATCSATIFMLSETAAFFEGEIVKGSCDHFQEWVESPAPTYDPDMSLDSVNDEPNLTAQRDPETLASGHRTFLASLTYALLLTDAPYTKDLRSLLGNTDNLVAFFSRLLDIQQKRELEEQTEGESGHTAQEEQRISLELDRARKKVDSDLKAVVSRLRQLDHERIGSMRFLDLRLNGEKGDFEVWKGGGVDRLLMKLEFGRLARDAHEID